MKHLFLWLLVAVLSSAADAKGLGVIDVPQGRSVSLALVGADYRGIDGVVAMREVRGRSTVAKAVRARLGAMDRSGKRWVIVDAAKDAAVSSYRLEGTRRGKPVLVVPALVRVVAARHNRSLPKAMRAAQRTDFPSARRATVDLATATVYDGRPLAATVAGSRSVSRQLARPEPATIAVLAEMEADIRRASGAPWGDGTGAGYSGPVAGSGSGSPNPPSNSAPAPLFADFDGDAVGVSWRQAYQLSLLSWLAYFPANQIPAIASEWGLDVNASDVWDVSSPWLWNASGSSQGFIATTDDAVFVVFRGSTTGSLGQDWWDNNIDVRPHVIPAWGAGVVMHHGFTEATAVAYPFLISRLPMLTQQGNRKVWVTGHSLGGAMATIAAFRLAQENVLIPHRVMTFGAPKVGNDFWRQSYEAKGITTVRWNRERDPAPTILPSALFSHVGDDFNLYQDTSHPSATHGWGQSAPPPLALDPSVALDRHMDYWCRLYDEAIVHGEPESLTPPPSNDTPGCMD